MFLKIIIVSLIVAQILINYILGFRKSNVFLKTMSPGAIAQILRISNVFENSVTDYSTNRIQNE